MMIVFNNVENQIGEYIMNYQVYSKHIDRDYFIIITLSLTR